MDNHTAKLSEHDTEIKFIKEMGSPKGDAGAGMLDAIKAMIKQAKDDLTVKINNVSNDLGLIINDVKGDLSGEIEALKKGQTSLEDRLRDLEAALRKKDDEQQKQIDSLFDKVSQKADEDLFNQAIDRIHELIAELSKNTG